MSFILRARNSDELQAQVLAGMPRGFMTTSQFANQYGQSPLVIAAIRAYLALNGIQSHVMADNLVIQTTGTAGQYNKAFQIVQQDYKVPAVPAKFGHGGHGSFVAHGSAKNPKVPTSISSVILAILGLSNYPTQESDTIGQAEPTVKSTSSSLPNSALLPGDFKTRYGLDPVAHAGGTGHGRTIGIVTLAGLDPPTLTDFWKQHRRPHGPGRNRITTINVDGGPGPPSDGGLGRDRPGRRAVRHARPEREHPRLPGAEHRRGFADAFFAAAATTWPTPSRRAGASRRPIIQASVNPGVEAPTYADTFDQAFLELAAQGQSAFVVRRRLRRLHGVADLGSTNLAAGQPGQQPVGHVGGRHDAAGGRSQITATVTAHLPGRADLGLGLAVAVLRRVHRPDVERPVRLGGRVRRGHPGRRAAGSACSSRRRLPAAGAERHASARCEYLTPIDHQASTA